MWNYEKRLEYPINIKETNPKLAQAIITQYGGPDGELGASMRYLSQRYTMPYREPVAILTDIGSEAAKLRIWAETYSRKCLPRVCSQISAWIPDAIRRSLRTRMQRKHSQRALSAL